MNLRETARNLRDYVATCDIYLNRRALVSHNWCVCLESFAAVGVHYREHEGRTVMAVGPFPRGMPTMFTRADAESVLRDAREFDARELRILSADDYWRERRAASVEALEFVEKALAAENLAAAVAAA